MGDVVNLQAVRADYNRLLGQYVQLARAIATLEKDPPADLLVRVIRAADRWRALDPDDTAVCRQAALIFQALGARELAWEYMVTPLAMKPNEAAPWTGPAQQLKGQGELDLAQRAYQSAFEAERTNAQILWDRAQLLQQLGRAGQAHELYRQIAEGKWPRQFNSVQAKAKSMLHDIWMASTRKDAGKAFDLFLETFSGKYPAATACLDKDRDALLAFYDFPAEHWAHLRTSNPIESTFASVRLRTAKTKGCGSRVACLSMVFKLALSAQKRWRALNGAKLLADVITGVVFEDGVKKLAA